MNGEMENGVVVEYAGIAGDGNGIVIIRHDDGSKTRYIHLNNFKVRNGQTVGPGTIIGRIAGEGEAGYGNSQGPHLHFESIVVVYDNEPRNSETVRKIGKAIDKGFKVCIWPQDLEHKDINDMIKAGLTPDQVEAMIAKVS